MASAWPMSHGTTSAGSVVLCFVAADVAPLLLLQIEEMVEVPVVLELASDLLDRRCPIFRWVIKDETTNTDLRTQHLPLEATVCRTYMCHIHAAAVACVCWLGQAGTAPCPAKTTWCSWPASCLWVFAASVVRNLTEPTGCVLCRDDTCVFVSQSGETADTLRALEYAKVN